MPPFNYAARCAFDQLQNRTQAEKADASFLPGLEQYASVDLTRVREEVKHAPGKSGEGFEPLPRSSKPDGLWVSCIVSNTEDLSISSVQRVQCSAIHYAGKCFHTLTGTNSSAPANCQRILFAPANDITDVFT
jgi:hypothetical protein